MEIEEAWAPVVTEQDIRDQGTLLDDSFLVQPNSREDKLKIVAKLYYLKSKNVFVTVINNFETVNDVHPIQVITDFEQIRSFRYQYLKEQQNNSTDAFAPMDISDYSSFKSDIDITNHETIKEHGRFLEMMSDADIYYLDRLDVFAAVNSTDCTSYLFQNNDLRKKYNIPYQDERLAYMF
jgi:hypothetical protein